MMNEKLEDILLKKGYLVTMPSGSSMLPLIRPDRDTVVIKRRIPKKYDVVLYKRDNGKYILHRVLKIKDKEYVMCGDNQWKKEFGITEQQILGVMDGFYSDNKYFEISSYRYKLYVRFWCCFLWLRKMMIYLFKIVNKLRHDQDIR